MDWLWAINQIGGSNFRVRIGVGLEELNLYRL